jgi:hypothetical protein
MTANEIGILAVNNEYAKEFPNDISKGLKELLETKHLYQSVRLSCEETFQRTKVTSSVTNFIPKAKIVFEQQVKSYIWYPSDASNSRPPAPNAEPINLPRFTTPDIKTYCQTCGRIEAFNSVSAEDFLGRNWGGPFQVNGETVQIFIFSFLCQSCKQIPEVFVVRRQGFKLTLSGRSPMEAVQVPQEIPKQVRHFYSGAIVAYQSGQVLSANFMLRTLIEQWIRSFPEAQNHLKADQAVDWYMSQLPKSLTDHFPSIRDMYSKLSVDIHTAKGDAELFESILGQICEHFQARQLFKLSGPP